ncbi:Peroxisomal multifunctional enzyme type 2 [Frankliniella fusca]|uniref:Peroxisomal multifunctional enzyme type 2 n=1 Tax=Frankliniella fusca TaxID=407009 RepID=A0AAE1LTI8_9NEOP|nr:Peroxisomal multifunctional enzyme type 2 [Frankliniella fusca]
MQFLMGSWVQHWARQWRAMLVLLSVLGLNCTRGWPPRPSRALRCYGGLLALFRVPKGVIVFVETASSGYSHSGETSGKEEYGRLLVLYDLAVKGVVSVLAQAMMLWRGGEDIHRLTQHTLLYSRIASPSSATGALALVAPMYALGLALTTFITVHVMASEGTIRDVLNYVLADLAPTFFVVMYCTMQLLLITQSAIFAADESQHVMMWISDASASATQPLALLRELRKLRVRQQVLHDMLLHCNEAFGWCILSSLLCMVIEIVLCLYLSVAYFQLQVTKSGAKTPLLLNPWLNLWGALQLASLMGMCVLGQWLSKILKSFTQQLRLQDNRPGIFNLLYFDFSTLKSVRI